MNSRRRKRAWSNSAGPWAGLDPATLLITYSNVMPTCFAPRQTARQRRREPSAVSVKLFGSRARLVKLRHAPLAEMLRTMHAIALLPNSIVPAVVTAYRRTPRLSSTAPRSAMRASTMLKTAAHSEQA
jgi:hypothetical protein